MRQKKRDIIKGIYLLPNIITTASLFCGIYSIILSIRGSDPTKAAYFILLATIFDFLDGFVARATKSCSQFGIEYDSLSDVICFGVAPSILFYTAFLVDLKPMGNSPVFIFIGCAALRLARFNSKIEGDEKAAFRGLPTTAATAFMASFFLIMKKYGLGEMFDNYIPLIMVAISFLMVSSIQYPAFNAVKFWKKKPFFYLGLFTIGMGMLFFFTEVFLFVITFGYIMYGLYGQLKMWNVFHRLASPFRRNIVSEKMDEFSHPAQEEKKMDKAGE